MKAAVYHGPLDVRVEEVPEPGPPGPDEILVAPLMGSLCGTDLSEFHSGYRLYSTRALAQIPFERNTQDFHFDTEIIIQFVLKNLPIVELPIPHLGHVVQSPSV